MCFQYATQNVGVLFDVGGVLLVRDAADTTSDIKENAKISGGGGLVSASATGKCEFTTYFAEKNKYDATKCTDAATNCCVAAGAESCDTGYTAVLTPSGDAACLAIDVATPKSFNCYKDDDPFGYYYGTTTDI